MTEMTVGFKKIREWPPKWFAKLFGSKGTRGANPMIQAALDAREDPGGLCTIREWAAYTIESKGVGGYYWDEMSFIADGKRVNVELVVTMIDGVTCGKQWNPT